MKFSDENQGRIFSHASLDVQSVLNNAAQRLKKVSDTAQLDAELLLAHTLNITRTQLLTHSDQILRRQQQQCFSRLLARREQGEPIAYILGRREFWSLNFLVTPATLIPRPETELLVELVLKQFPADEVIKLADLGTGCGAIALALGKERPNWSIIATDKSLDAIVVAKQNAKDLAITNVTFRIGDWCDALNAEKFDVIVSNPPYISTDDPHLQQGDLRFEPSIALISAQQGLADLEKIVAGARKHLFIDGYLFVEHGYDQSEAVQKIFSHHHYKKIKKYTDFIGIKRIVSGRL